MERNRIIAVIIFAMLVVAGYASTVDFTQSSNTVKDNFGENWSR